MSNIESQTIEKTQNKKTEISQEEVFSEEEIKQEFDPLLRRTHLHFKELLNMAEKVNKEMIKHEKLPVVSQQEAEDIQIHGAHKGWLKYWIPRLISEIDILPNKIAHVVKKLDKNNVVKQGEINSLNRYINKRTGVLRFNMEKRLAMAELKQRLYAIDRQEDYSEDERKNRKTIFYNEDKNELFVYENEKKKKITFGDIVADNDWGIKYRPDKSIPRNIWRKIRKLSDITEAKSNIEKVFNNELSYIEKIGLPTTAMPAEFLEKQINALGIEGAIAERVVTDFLIRMQYNNEIPFQVESCSAIEDVKLKYDFKIVVPDKIRGVAIEGEDIKRDEFVANKKRIGIQFTVSQGKKILKEKRKQIPMAIQRSRSKAKYLKFIKKSVDDIVLVSLPLGTYKNHFKKWVDNGKPSGGPEQYLTDEEKTRIFKKITENFIDLSDEQLQQLNL